MSKVYQIMSSGTGSGSLLNFILLIPIMRYFSLLHWNFWKLFDGFTILMIIQWGVLSGRMFFLVCSDCKGVCVNFPDGTDPESDYERK